MHTAEPWQRLGPTAHVATRDDLVDLLRDQHEELRDALARLPELSGAARDDEFLLARRRLAVHEALESMLLPGATGPGDAVAPAAGPVQAAERLDTGDRDFEAAAGRLLVAHQRHSEQQESSFRSLSGDLTAAEQAVLETARALWLGEGDAYLGHDYRDMVASARSQLEEASAPGHGLRP